MTSLKSAVLYGFLVWLVPFAVSIPLFTPDGEPRIDVFLFKTIMLIIGSVTGAALLVRYFRKVNSDYVAEGVKLGTLWLVMNWGLDFATIVSFNGMPVGTYFTEIGLRYLNMPIFSIAIGLALAHRTGSAASA